MSWSEKMLAMISVFLNSPSLAFWPSMWSVLERVPCALEKNACPLLPDGVHYVTVVQSLSRVQRFATPWTAARQASLSIAHSWSSDSCLSSRWCHPTISSSVIPFSSCLQSFPASGSFPVSQFFASGGQCIGASASVLLMNIQGWFLLGLTSLISLQSKELSRVFSNTTVEKHQFFGAQPSIWSNSHIHTWLLEKP